MVTSIITPSLKFATEVPNGLYNIAAALIALIGVWVTLWAHSRRERKQREHEMVRDVYFQMAEAISRFYEAIGSYPNVRITDEELRKSIKDYFLSSAKMQLVGSMQSITNLSRLTSKFTKAIMALGLKRGELMNLKAAHDAVLRNMQELMDRIKQIRPAGAQQSSVEIESLGPIWRDLESREISLRKQLLDGMVAVSQVAQTHINDMAEIQIAAVFEGRRALGFKFDESEYRRQALEANKEAQAVMQDLVAKLKVAPSFEAQNTQQKK